MIPLYLVELAGNVRNVLELEADNENDSDNEEMTDSDYIELARNVRSVLELEAANENDTDEDEDDENDNNSNSTDDDGNNEEPGPDPEIEMGRRKTVFEDTQIKVSYSRVAFQKLTRFHLSNYLFSLKIALKKNAEDDLMISALVGIMSGLTAIFEDLKQEFEIDLNRNMYITIVHDNLSSAIQIGPINFETESVTNIVQRIQEKIERTLESHQTMKIDKSLQLYIRVLGES